VPSALHEILIELFRHRPGWAAELLTGLFAWPVPAFQQARLEAGDFSDLAATEYRADAVVVRLADDAPVLAVLAVVVVVVEAQLRRDPDKRWSWPV
jgi:hypothetical protein